MKECLFYANPQTCADMLFFTGFNAPDPFLAFSCRGKKIALLSPLEVNRARKGGHFHVVYSHADVVQALGQPNASLAEKILYLAAQHGLSHFRVPENFPCKLFEVLKSQGLSLTIQDDPFFKERQYKSSAQQADIAEANRITASAIDRAYQILKAAEIVGDRIYYHNQPLTCEFLQQQIALCCLEQGAIAQHSIVACGEQGTDPHCRGSGYVLPHQFIIVDVFPRVEASGYFGDMTRTFLKGVPSAAQKRLWETVAQAQTQAIQALRPGVKLSTVHRSVENFFKSRGYVTVLTGPVPEGFFHSTGHGLGLDLHEAPRVSRNSLQKAREGLVVTIEPGLYYPGLGGVRIEDVVVVKEGGCGLLSNYPYHWHIP